jgi:hypothetical protein
VKSSTSNWELLELLNKASPKLCRLLARTPNGLAPKSNSQIARDAGLARSTVVQIYNRNTWNNVPLATIIKFATGCGVNLLNPNAKVQVLRKGAHYLKKANSSQRRLYDRLLPKRRGPELPLPEGSPRDSDFGLVPRHIP